ncbi:MAG: hypothetical protein R3B64_02440 [Candidatus Paceibacterota bacterium]
MLDFNEFSKLNIYGINTKKFRVGKSVSSVMFENVNQVYSLSYDIQKNTLCIDINKEHLTRIKNEFKKERPVEMLKEISNEYKFKDWVFGDENIGFGGCIKVKNHTSSTVRLEAKYDKKNGLCVAKSLSEIFERLNYTDFDKITKSEQSCCVKMSIEGVRLVFYGCAIRIDISPKFSFWLYKTSQDENILGKINEEVEKTLMASYKSLTGEKVYKPYSQGIERDGRIHLSVPSGIYTSELFTDPRDIIEKAESVKDLHIGQHIICHNMDIWPQAMCTLAGFAKVCEIFERST